MRVPRNSRIWPDLRVLDPMSMLVVTPNSVVPRRSVSVDQRKAVIFGRRSRQRDPGLSAGPARRRSLHHAYRSDPSDRSELTPTPALRASGGVGRLPPALRGMTPQRRPKPNGRNDCHPTSGGTSETPRPIRCSTAASWPEVSSVAGGRCGRKIGVLKRSRHTDSAVWRPRISERGLRQRRYSSRFAVRSWVAPSCCRPRSKGLTSVTSKTRHSQARAAKGSS